MPPGDGEAPVRHEPYAVAGGAQVEVVAGQRVSADTAAVPLAQKVAAELGRPRHVGDVLAQTVSEEGFHLGAVTLQKTKDKFRTLQTPVSKSFVAQLWIVVTLVERCVTR